MTKRKAAARKPRGGLADKRRAIVAGALTVFARDGYARASIDSIAAAAGVSTRTLYNHFLDKAQLFQTVIHESATQAAAAQIAVIDRYLSKVTDLEADLLEFGVALAQPLSGSSEHFALVRQINAEAEHVPEPAVEAWQEAGPRRVRRELAARLQKLADRKLLRRLDDAERAALHLMRLISVADPAYHRVTRSEQEVEELISAGVRVFLHGYIR